MFDRRSFLQLPSPYTMPTLDCPSCRTEMDPGFLIDKGDGQVPSQQEWAEGAAEKSFWTGLKLKGRVTVPVVTYRCPRCGLLQSYAPDA